MHFEDEPTILIVEDDPSSGGVLARMLGKRFPGSMVHCASNGKEGLEMFGRYLPNIVITDIWMPELSGVEMAQIISSISAETRFILITADYSTAARLVAQGAGFEVDRYLLKPIDFELLFAAILRCKDNLARNSD